MGVVISPVEFNIGFKPDQFPEAIQDFAFLDVQVRVAVSPFLTVIALRLELLILMSTNGLAVVVIIEVAGGVVGIILVEVGVIEIIGVGVGGVGVGAIFVC